MPSGAYPVGVIYKDEDTSSSKHLAFLLLSRCFFSTVKAQSILFDFDNAPLHSPLPVNLTVGGVTAHFSGNPSYYNYSIQRADALGFTPAGFAGYCLCPSTVFPCDLLISFDHTLSAISIMYAPEESLPTHPARCVSLLIWAPTWLGQLRSRSLNQARGQREPWPLSSPQTLTT